MTALRLAAVVVAAGAMAGCAGVQSTLDPMSQQATHVSTLYWVMTAAGAAIVVILTLAVVVSLNAPNDWRRRIGTDEMVFGGGVAFPAIVLLALFLYSLSLLDDGAVAKPEGAPIRIAVEGHRWWWRVSYRGADGARIETANELRVPINAPIEVELTSKDVIHSFWPPRLSGKRDMIPGHTNILKFVATKSGVSRGQCAEYCGGAHALMGFYVVATTQEEFENWLSGQAQTARAPDSVEARKGMEKFFSSGCGACHSIRGTTAVGGFAPDLTHVGSRLSIGAATLDADAASIARWITDNQHVKPGNLMPAFDNFKEDEIAALATYLASLR